MEVGVAGQRIARAVLLCVLVAVALACPSSFLPSFVRVRRSVGRLFFEDTIARFLLRFVVARSV